MFLGKLGSLYQLKFLASTNSIFLYAINFGVLYTDRFMDAGAFFMGCA